MPDPVDERRAPLSPQLALRVAIVGSVVLALFAVIFFRLWFLQVLSGSSYVAQAKVNRIRDVDLPAQRGEILDRNGQVLVDSKKAVTVQVAPDELPVKMSLANIRHPPRRDEVVFDRLAHILKISTKRSACTIAAPNHNHPRLSPIACKVAQQLSLQPFGAATVRPRASKYLEYYLAEHQNEYPGIDVQQTWITGYPHGDLAAQVLGTVGPITPTEVKAKSYAGANKRSIVGQSGLEAQYDSFLRGSDGKQRVEIDAEGQPTGIVKTVNPVPGHFLQTSLDLQLQRVGQESLLHSIGLNASPGGAFVAMNPDTGEIYAMGSEPSYNANAMVPPVSTRAYERLTNPDANQPLLNRAIASVGPTGSTFKPITATAALESGAWSVDDTFNDTGRFCISGECRQNSGGAVDGQLNLVSALKVSSDDFFYNLGARLNPADPATHPDGGALQRWAREFGIGRSPGVDLPGARPGTLPDPRWRERRNQLEADCDQAIGPYRYSNGKQISSKKLPGYHRSPRHPAGGCGIADGSDRPWSIGDDENLAVGQGDVQVSPLQLATAYSAIADNGYVARPHIGLDVENADNTVLQKVGPDPPARHLQINPLYLQTILTGLHEATSQPGGTSYDVMGKFPEQVYGKTGTAQYSDQPDYGWYSCFVPSSATSKPIEVVVWVEQGSFGDISAAPVARQILSQWFLGKPGPYITGSSPTL